MFFTTVCPIYFLKKVKKSIIKFTSVIKSKNVCGKWLLQS